MKSQAAVIVILIGLVAVGGMVYGAHRFSNPRAAAPQAASPTPKDKEQAFIDEARQLAAKNPQADAAAPGTLPPVTGDTTNVPSIFVDPPVLDMGTVAREGLATGEFKVLNKGKANLDIAQVSTSCGCTKASVDPAKKTVPPGGETVVTVTIDPKRISGFESTKTVTVTSNDPQYPRTNVQVIAKIDPEFSVEPPDIDFGEVRKGTPAEKTLVFRQLTDEPIEVLELRTMSKESPLENSFVKRPENEWAKPGHAEYLITARIPEEASPGAVDGQFQIQSTCKRLPSYMVKVRGNVTSFYTITPPKALALRSSMQPGQPARVTATINSSQPFDVQELTSSASDLEIALNPGAAPNSKQIQVTLKPDAVPGQRSETVSFTIKSGEETLKERIPVRVYAARPATVRPTPATAPPPGTQAPSPIPVPPASVAPLASPKPPVNAPPADAPKP